MNDLTKYKAWDKESKNIFDVDKIDFDKKEVSYVNSPSGYDVDALLEQVILLPFVGVKDKNKDYIHYGHILKISFTQTNVVISKVDFNRGIFFVLDEKGQYHPMSEFFYDLNNSSKQLQIIGNIFEDENLLN